MLLYSHSTTRKVEQAFLELLKQISEEFEEFKKLFLTSEEDFCVVFEKKEKIYLLELPFVKSVFDAFDWIKPRCGKVFWRIPGYFSTEKLVNLYGEFFAKYAELKILEEKVLLEKGDVEFKEVRNKKKNRPKEKRRVPRARATKKREIPLEDDDEILSLLQLEEADLITELDNNQNDFETELAKLREARNGQKGLKNIKKISEAKEENIQKSGKTGRLRRVVE